MLTCYQQLTQNQLTIGSKMLHNQLLLVQSWHWERAHLSLCEKTF